MYVHPIIPTYLLTVQTYIHPILHACRIPSPIHFSGFDLYNIHSYPNRSKSAVAYQLFAPAGIVQRRRIRPATRAQLTPHPMD